MAEFTASNGVKVLTLANGIGFQRPNKAVSSWGIHAHEVDALREFFQHERDEELGRWRYPADNRYVVHGGYSSGGERRFARVVNEETGSVSVLYEGSDHRSEVHDVATAYFEAHPERKPWEDAQPGEAWEITYLPLVGRELTKVAIRTDRNTWKTDVLEMEFNHAITRARRIWPEGDAS